MGKVSRNWVTFLENFSSIFRWILRLRVYDEFLAMFGPSAEALVSELYADLHCLLDQFWQLSDNARWGRQLARSATTHKQNIRLRIRE